MKTKISLVLVPFLFCFAGCAAKQVTAFKAPDAGDYQIESVIIRPDGRIGLEYKVNFEAEFCAEVSELVSA